MHMPEKTVKVCSYNVQMKDQYPGQAYENESRARLIAGLLARSDYDVLVFEEAFDNKARAVMADILMKEGGYKYRTAVVGSDEFNPFANTRGDYFLLVGGLVGGAVGGHIGGGALVAAGLGLVGGAVLVGAVLVGLFVSGHPKSDGGVFIMSRWPIALQSQIVYSAQAEGFDRFSKKGASWALINKEGFYFNVFGTHTQSGDVDLVDLGQRLDRKNAEIRANQFAALRAMLDGVQMYWMPALVAGDLNVDFCFDRDRCPDNGEGRDGCCSTRERGEMLATLRSAMPHDLSRLVYTSDPANELKSITDPPRTLDYVLHSETHRVPLRSSLETLKLQASWQDSGGRSHRDLSDHYAVVATSTFRHIREDCNRFTGIWRCVEFNGRPDTHNHRLTFYPYGAAVINEFDGQTTGERIHMMEPGPPEGGGITFKQYPSGRLNGYRYTFDHNPDFNQYYIPGDLPGTKRPRRENQLLFTNRRGANILYAFESWLPIGELDRPRGDPV